MDRRWLVGWGVKNEIVLFEVLDVVVYVDVEMGD